VILAFLGEQNVSSVSIQQLATKDKFVIASLYGKMANIRDDLSKDVIYSGGKIKELTGRFQVEGQKKFGDPFNFTNRAYFIFSCNALPPVQEDDSAYFNCVLIRLFKNKFGGYAKPDRELQDKLTTPDELSGILNWALEGLKRLRDNGWNFGNTITVDETREEYKRKSDPVWAYATDRLLEDSEGEVFKEALYNDFKGYCKDKKIPLLSRDTFFKTLPEKVTVASGQRQDPKGGGKKHCFVGIKLKEQGEQAEQGTSHLMSGVCLVCHKEDASLHLSDGKQVYLHELCESQYPGRV
jgi:putative DNA primase/helicase